MGYVFKKLDYPIAPLVLAMVLGDKAEDAFRQSMIMSKGSLSIFWSNGLVGTLITLGMLLALWPVLASAAGSPDCGQSHRPRPLEHGHRIELQGGLGDDIR